MKVKVLDCTLRDGGYINNWQFGYNYITGIVNKLIASGVDIIEVGFLDDTNDYDRNQTLFPSTKDIRNIIDDKLCLNEDIAAMIMLGKCSIENIQDKKDSCIDTIRLCFKKEQIVNAIEYSKRLIEKGYKLFWQPASITDYSDNEVLYLLEKANELDLFSVYIVDTYGLMTKYDLVRYFYLFNTNLKKNVTIGFHSHNNLQLSFSNSLALFEIHPKRNIIVDSSVFGMGRGAGNLCTELLTKYLNDNFESKYNLIPILEIVDRYINPIFEKSPWGYSVAYYIAATNYCHPNYASYLVNKQTIGVKAINTILSQIPEVKKRHYTKDIIEELYIKYQEHEIDDSKAISIIKDRIMNRNILILAPGKSLKTHKHRIDNYIKQNNPYIFSVNFLQDEYNINSVFVSNMKRFENIKKNDIQKIIITSNVSNSKNNEFLTVNYSSLIDTDFEEIDNAGIMLLRLLDSIGISNITAAGFDGFSTNPHDNYYSDSMILNVPAEIIDARNKNVAEQIIKITRNINIDFLTPSVYADKL